jgi:hypothetical protein
MSDNFHSYDVLCHRETCQHIEVMIYGLWERPDPSVGLIGSLLDVEVHDMRGNELDVEEYCSIRGHCAGSYIQEIASDWYSRGEP